MKFRFTPAQKPPSPETLRHTALQLGTALREHIGVMARHSEDMRMAIEGLQSTGLSGESFMHLERDLDRVTGLADHLDTINHHLAGLETAAPELVGRQATAFIRWLRPMMAEAEKTPARFFTHSLELTHQLGHQKLSATQAIGGNATLHTLMDGIGQISASSTAMHDRYTTVKPIVIAARKLN